MASTTSELAAVLARLGELTDAATADTTSGDRTADAARIDQIALLERIAAAARGDMSASLPSTMTLSTHRRCSRSR